MVIAKEQFLVFCEFNLSTLEYIRLTMPVCPQGAHIKLTWVPSNAHKDWHGKRLKTCEHLDAGGQTLGCEITMDSQALSNCG